MIGTGGSALTAKYLGEREKDKANRCFTMMILLTVISGIVLSAFGMIFIRPIACLLGASGEMVGYCVTYGRVVMAFNTAFMLQNVFQTFFTTAEKPHLGLFFTLAAGFTNMALDALFIAAFDWGVAGAALAPLLLAVGGHFLVGSLANFFGGQVSVFSSTETITIMMRRVPTSCGILIVSPWYRS